MGLRVAVVGHVEWTTIVRVTRLPTAGEICPTDRVWEGPAGGGAVAAVRIAALTGGCDFFTRLGDDAEGHQTRKTLQRYGVRLHTAPPAPSTARALSVVDESGERTTLTIGDRPQPTGAEPLPWTDLDDFDAAYFTAGDPEALKQARRARVLVVTLRELATVAAAGIGVDALVGSACDPAEQYRPPAVPPRLLVRTDGARGGSYLRDCGTTGRYPVVAPPGPPVDTYGIGDNFVASLTVALGSGSDPDTALRAAAADGAACLATRGPYRKVF
ncbi:PfkB family carbohydrate kinase [Actinoplanes regularis]|uniref:Ribokinase n=1 Tax=Actinoplanes regularis TaxID=52697 RepID=A0A239A5A0_9ACTN|nr:PfkB family carbohydrate kinase [Actinoplanes regularis]GIE87091.1 ribokinase [Actinoplanes regularis]SNR90679.1 ribokinase [Actinoplanes regularis]